MRGEAVSVERERERGRERMRESNGGRQRSGDESQTSHENLMCSGSLLEASIVPKGFLCESVFNGSSQAKANIPQLNFSNRGVKGVGRTQWSGKKRKIRGENSIDWELKTIARERQVGVMRRQSYLIVFSGGARTGLGL